MEALRHADEQYATAIFISRKSDQLRQRTASSGQADYSAAMADFDMSINLHPDFAFARSPTTVTP